jgi:hypothetical protein
MYPRPTNTVKRSLLLLVLVSFLHASAPAVQADRGTVAGFVLLENNQPAPGASVLLEGTKLGAVVDSDGAFLVGNVPPGNYRLQARLIGYRQPDSTSVAVSAGDTAHVTLRLRQDLIEFNTVVITGSRRQAAEDTRSSVTSLAPRESKILPGAAEDVLRSLQALPGVTSVSDFSSQLVVRGSGPDQNLIMIDGFEVLNPYRLYGFVSMFNPETISDISLQTGGFAAQYGDRLSAVLDVRNREGRTDSYFGGKINVSLTNLNAIVEGSLPIIDGDYLLSFRRTYYDLILGPALKAAKLVQGDVALPNFRDFQAKLAFPLNSSHKIILNAVTSRDGVDLVSGTERQRPDSVNVFDQSYNTLIGATWQFNPRQNLIAETRLSWYRNRGAGDFDGKFVDPSQNTGALGRADTVGRRYFQFGVNYDYVYSKTSFTQSVLWTTGSHALEGGYGIDFLRTDYIRTFVYDQGFLNIIEARGVVVPTDATESVNYNRFNFYAQDKISLTDRLFFQPGLRVDVYPTLERTVYVAPRLNVSFKLDEISTLRAAYGIYYQSPGMDKMDFRNQVIYTRDYFRTLVAGRADHYVLGYDRLLTPEWQFKVETYYKRFTSLVVPQKLQGMEWYTQPLGGNVLNPSNWTHPVLTTGDSLTNRPVNDAVGESYGIEFMLQKIRSLPSDRFTGWVSYAYAFAQRDRDGILTPFLFDQRHAANVVGNYRFAERWDVGVRWTVRSGRPYPEATGVQPRVMIQDVNGIPTTAVQVDANGRVILDVVYERDTYSGRLSLYHTLDLRITTYPQWFNLDWSVYLDVQNVYNRQNEQQVRYFIDENGDLNRRAIYGIPIFPSLGLSVVF